MRRLLETLQEWLVPLPLDRVPYHAILDLVDNKMRVSWVLLSGVLPTGERVCHAHTLLLPHTI